jgi:glycosyltransferase involved in cell wall biosynthesis
VKSQSKLENTPTPELSVVMGLFNGAACMTDTVLSVLAEHAIRLEFIVINDGSTDGTRELLNSMAATDSRLVLLHQSNTGLTRALRNGCDLARGEYIARIDAGDIALPGRFQKQLAVLRQSLDVAFVSTGTRYVEPGGALLFEKRGTGFASQPQDIIDLNETHGLKDGPSHHGAVMFRADAYRRAGGYRSEFYFGQDWDLWYRLAEVGRFQMLDEVLYQATIGVGDISTSHKAEQEQLARLSLQAFRLRLQGQSDAEILVQAARIRPSGQGSPRKRIAGGNYFLGECLRRNGDAKRARDYFTRALRHQPWNVKAWIRLAQTVLKSRA